MKHSLTITGTAVMISLASIFTGCKPTEKNYRQAYQKAMDAAAENNVTDFDHTIYNRYRGQMRDITVKGTDGADVNVRTARVTVTPDGGGINEWLKAYSVVVGEFKQLFNARSLRSRMVEAGYPRTFIVQNAEPYYFIVAESYPDASQAAAVADSIEKARPLPFKQGFPYILKASGR